MCSVAQTVPRSERWRWRLQGLNCSQFIPPGTVLSVVAAAPCSLPYAITPVDTCDSVDALFGLNGALQDLNPALNCSNLFPGLQVCRQTITLNPTP